MASAVEIFNTAINNLGRIELLNSMFRNMQDAERVLLLLKDWKNKYGDSLPPLANSKEIREAVNHVYGTSLEIPFFKAFDFLNLAKFIQEKIPSTKKTDITTQTLKDQASTNLIELIIAYCTMVLGPLFKSGGNPQSEFKTHILAQICDDIFSTKADTEKHNETLIQFFATRTYDPDEFKVLIGNTLSDFYAMFSKLFALQRLITVPQFAILMGNLPTEYRFDLFLTGRYKEDALKKFKEDLENNVVLFPELEDILSKMQSYEEFEEFMQKNTTLLYPSVEKIEKQYGLETPISMVLFWSIVHGLIKKLFARLDATPVTKDPPTTGETVSVPTEGTQGSAN